MIEYLVEHEDHDGPDQFFKCQADDIGHAVEQTEDAYPRTTILRIYELTLVHDATADDDEG